MDGKEGVPLEVNSVDPKGGVPPCSGSPELADLRTRKDGSSDEFLFEEVDVVGAGLDGECENGLEDFGGQNFDGADDDDDAFKSRVLDALSTREAARESQPQKVKGEEERELADGAEGPLCDHTC